MDQTQISQPLSPRTLLSREQRLQALLWQGRRLRAAANRNIDRAKKTEQAKAAEAGLSTTITTTTTDPRPHQQAASAF